MIKYFYIKQVIRELTTGKAIFDYLLKNDMGITVGKFHDQELALEVCNLLNKEREK